MTNHKSIVVYRRTLLKYSETFIADQARGFGEFTPVMAGFNSSPGVDISDLSVSWLGAMECFRNKTPRLRSVIDMSTMDRSTIGKIAATDPCVVLCHFGTDAAGGARLARRLGVPLVVVLHGYDITTRKSYWHRGKGGLHMTLYPETLLRLANSQDVHFVAVSKFIAEEAKAFGIPESKISVQYTGIDPTKFRPGAQNAGSRPPEVIFSGRLVEKKNCASAIRAVSDLSRIIPDIHLTVVGDGPHRNRLQRMTYDLDAPVTFVGKCDAREMRNRIMRARVMCTPSVRARNGDSEGFGMVLLEAQACGVPVVTSADGGAREGIIHGETGFRFRQADDAGMTEYLRMILTDDDLATRFGLSGPGFVSERFDIANCARNLESHIMNLG